MQPAELSTKLSIATYSGNIGHRLNFQVLQCLIANPLIELICSSVHTLQHGVYVFERSIADDAIDRLAVQLRHLPQFLPQYLIASSVHVCIACGTSVTNICRA